MKRNWKIISALLSQKRLFWEGKRRKRSLKERGGKAWQKLLQTHRRYTGKRHEEQVRNQPPCKAREGLGNQRRNAGSGQSNTAGSSAPFPTTWRTLNNFSPSGQMSASSSTSLVWEFWRQHLGASVIPYDMPSWASGELIVEPPPIPLHLASEMQIWGWKYGSVVKNAVCFSRRPESESQHPWQVAQNLK